jgi:hypothetical protein
MVSTKCCVDTHRSVSWCVHFASSHAVATMASQRRGNEYNWPTEAVSQHIAGQAIIFRPQGLQGNMLPCQLTKCTLQFSRLLAGRTRIDGDHMSVKKCGVCYNMDPLECAVWLTRARPTLAVNARLCQCHALSLLVIQRPEETSFKKINSRVE